MQLLLEFFPIALFFIAYKIFDIYTATGVAIVATIIQMSIMYKRQHRIETMQIITLAVIIIFGGATILLHDELFIKWKPSIINWLFGLVFYLSQHIGSKPFIQRLMEKNIVLDNAIWRRLNSMWSLFFILMGIANIYVVYHFDTDTWVNFKLFGMLGLTVLFVIAQGIYLAKHIQEPHHHD